MDASTGHRALGRLKHSSIQRCLRCTHLPHPNPLVGAGMHPSTRTAPHLLSGSLHNSAGGFAIKLGSVQRVTMAVNKHSHGQRVVAIERVGVTLEHLIRDKLSEEQAFELRKRKKRKTQFSENQHIPCRDPSHAKALR